MVRKTTKPKKPRKGFRYHEVYGWYWYEDENSLDRCIEFWSCDHTPIAFTRPGPPAPVAQGEPETAPEEPPAKARLNGE